MRLTNKYGLPEVFETYTYADKYSPGDADFSVTTLIDSPRIRMLRHRHWDDIEVDVSERLWAIMGTAVHAILEEAAHFDHVSEQRYYANFPPYTISGQIDLIQFDKEGIHIMDFKTTSVWAILLDKDKPEWVKQLNCYAYLAALNLGAVVKSAKICAVIRDWSRRKAEQEQDYPNAPIMLIDVPLWTFEEQEEYIQARIELFERVAKPGGDYYCSPEERWARPDSYAVVKGKNKRASRVFETGDKARLWKEQQKKPDDYKVEYRPGESVRCEADYCGVASWCEQFKKMKEERDGSQCDGSA